MKILLFIILCLSAQAADIYPVGASGSMKPLFDENYFLYVEKKPWKDVVPGDIIIYKPLHPESFNLLPDSTIVHKVWQKSSGGSVILCWGINNAAPDDEFITESMYVGTVVKWVTREEYFK